MREVAQRRQQLEVEHEQARLRLQEKQEEVRRLQQVGAGLGGSEWGKGGRLPDPQLYHHSSSGYLLRTHCVPGTVPGAGGTGRGQRSGP